MRKILKSLAVILLATSAIGQNLPNIDTGTKGQLPVSRLKAGTSGTQCLFTDSLLVFWGTCASGTGTVTNVNAGSLAPLFTTVVSTPSTTPSLAFTLSNFAPHTFYGNNTSGTAVPGAQTIGIADLPGSGAVAINTTSPLGGGGSLILGGSLSLTCASCVTSIPQQPITKTAVASNWINSYDSTTGLFTATRPAYTDLTGLPQLAVTKAAVASNWLRSYDSTTGLFTANQPAYSDISGTPQLAVTKAAIASNWIRSYDSTTGLFTASQPAYSDITGTPTLPATLASSASKWFNSYNSVTGLFSATQPTSADLSDFPSQVGNSGKFLSTNGTVLSFASGNSGTVTSFSSGNLSPLFTTSVATATTTPAQTFSLSTAAAHLFFGNNTAITAAPAYEAIGNGDLPGAGSITLNTTAPITGGGSVSLGSSLTFACASCLTSVTAHNLLSATHGDTTTHTVSRGDFIAGIGAVPTWTAVAKGGTNAYPKWNASGDMVASTLAASGVGSPTSCTNQAVTAFTLVADAAPTSTCSTITSAFTSGTFPATAHNLLSATHGDTTPGSVVTGDVISGQSSAWARLGGNISTTPQYLKSLGSGAAATAPSWAQVAYTDLSGVPATFAPTAHNILSASHGDTTAAAAVRGDGFFAIGATPTWQRLAHPTVTGGYFKWNGTDIVVSTLAAAGTGNCGANQFETGSNADAAPTCAQPAYSGISGTPAVPTGTGYSHVTSGALDSAAKLINLTASTDVAANQGTVNQVLHGNAAGQASFSAVTSADTTGTFPSTPHALLDGSVDSDTTAGTVARGDLITGQTVTPKWTRLAKGTANQLLAMDATGTDIVWAAPPGGTGTVTSFSAGTLSPLFTTSVATATTTPALTFTLSNAAANTVFGNNTSGSAAPGFQSLVAAQEPATTVNSVVNDTNVTGSIAAQALTLGWTGTLSKARNLATAVYADQSNTYSTGTTQAMDTATAKFWGSAPIFDATKYAGADPCAKILAVYSDAAYLALTSAIIDATGFTGSQNCASNMLAAPHYTWIKLGAVTLHVTVNQAPSLSSGVLSAPATPTAASTAATGGTLSNAVFVRVGYVTPWESDTSPQFGPSGELTVTMGGTCAGTPTCTATINSPAVAVAAYAYNIFESNTTGTEKKCNVAPIPLGVNFTIKANCAGQAINTSNIVAFNGVSILSGIGDTTQISLESAAASIDGSGAWNWQFKDMAIMSTLTTQSVNGMLQLNQLSRAENITFSGGGNHLYIIGSMVTVKRTRHYGFTQTTGPVAGILAFNVSELRIEDTVFSNFTFPVSPTTNYGIQLNQCYMCTVDGERSENVDNSLAVNGGSMLVATGDNTVANASSHILFANFTCDFLINVNCADFTGMTDHAQMLNGDCNNTNNVAGIGANILGADCYDIFMAANYTLTNLKGRNRGGPGGACCPTLEIYSSTDGTVNGGEFSDDKSNEGVRIVGSPALSFNGVITSRNTNSGVVLADATTVVTCNGTTTVVWVSGQPFGPWKLNQQVGIGAGPTFFNLDHTVDSHTIVLTTTCGLGASQAFFVATADFTVNGGKSDDNGQAGTGTGVRTGLAEAYYFSGHSAGSLNGLTCNDNAPILANKHQQYCARAENNAIFTVSMVDGSGNGGGSNCGKVLKPMGAATEWFCDSVGNSGGIVRDGTTSKVISLTPLVSNFGVFDQGQSATVADSGSINTTETIIAKSLALPANRLVAGTVIRIPFVGTNTSSVANTSTFTLRMGTAGTTADTAIFTAVMAVSAATGTNVPFEGEVICNVRTIGASGTGFCKINLNNPNTTSVATASTGISVIPMQLVLPTMSTFNTTTANNIISLSYKSAATTTTSIFKIGDVLFSHL